MRKIYIFRITIDASLKTRYNHGILSKYNLLRKHVITFFIAAKDLEKTVTMAVDSCSNDGILMDFLIKHNAEVIGMCLTEYDEAEQRKMDRQEGLDEGLHSIIIALKRFTPDFNSLYTEVVNTPAYAEVSEEEVRRIYDEV